MYYYRTVHVKPNKGLEKNICEIFKPGFWLAGSTAASQSEAKFGNSLDKSLMSMEWSCTRTVHMAHALYCLIVVLYPVSYNHTLQGYLLTLMKYCDCHSASDTTMKNKGKLIPLIS